MLILGVVIFLFIGLVVFPIAPTDYSDHTIGYS